MALPFAIPSTLPPAFTISRCEATDVEELGHVYYESFRTDARNTYWWSPSREQMMAFMRQRIKKRLADRKIRHFKIMDVESGNLVAWARWDVPKGPQMFGDWYGVEDPPVDVSNIANSEKEVDVEPIQENSRKRSADVNGVETPTKPVEIPEGANEALARNFFAGLAKASDKWFKEDMLGLGLICTDPRYHRRGAATALMAPMLELADAHGLTTYLEATPAGKPVYEKLGFRGVDTIDFDLEKLTNDLTGLYTLTVMLRAPLSVQ